MAVQQWLFSFKGRIGRHDFWIWIGLWLVDILVLFSLTGKNLPDIQTAAFCPVCLPWPTTMITVRHLYDRGRSGAWTFLMIMARMLLVGNWAVLPGVWQWTVGRFIPTLILVMVLTDLGTFVGTQGENRYGKDTQDVKYKADSKSNN